MGDIHHRRQAATCNKRSARATYHRYRRGHQRRASGANGTWVSLPQSGYEHHPTEQQTHRATVRTMDLALFFILFIYFFFKFSQNRYMNSFISFGSRNYNDRFISLPLANHNL